ncbi:hypothetical protein J7L02_01890 [Candidatus Woesearchaeota archaeon]|nr:hypothetical protein [Candidatus Woesearchaeota archaeon]
MFLKHRKGQNFTVDLLIAVVIFFVVISIFYGLSVKRSPLDKEAVLTQEARTAITALVSSTDVGLITDSGQVNQTVLQSLYNLDLEDLKKFFSTDKDFCIVLRGPNNQIIPIPNPDNPNYKKIGLGSPKFNISNCQCGVEYESITTRDGINFECTVPHHD